MCQRDLAKIILKDRPSTGRILNSLEQKGYVERVAGTKNNRLVRKIILTEDGKIILSDITLKIKEYLQNIPRAFSTEKIEDMKSLMQGFREILKNEVELNI
jgi:DNA-binding MarR family transcriptional regulator